MLHYRYFSRTLILRHPEFVDVACPFIRGDVSVDVIGVRFYKSVRIRSTVIKYEIDLIRAYRAVGNKFLISEIQPVFSFRVGKDRGLRDDVIGIPEAGIHFPRRGRRVVTRIAVRYGNVVVACVFGKYGIDEIAAFLVSNAHAGLSEALVYLAELRCHSGLDTGGSLRQSYVRRQLIDVRVNLDGVLIITVGEHDRVIDYLHRSGVGLSAFIEIDVGA